MGGFSRTFLAEDLHLPGHPRCVVKQLKPQVTDFSHLQTARRLFDTEAAVLYQLGHHNQIPRLLAHFEENAEFYLIQELIEGESLSKRLIPGQPWSEAQVICLLQDILQVLAFVHDQQVIHRDIKPSNLMCRTDGKIVLIDFGAVKQVSTQLSESKWLQTATVSVGTHGYMPVEQLSGHPRFNSDIYAVGMIGIQALTGIHPKRLERDLHTGEIDWRKPKPDAETVLLQVSSELSVILDRMVRYHFKDRYQTVAEVLEELEPLFQGLDQEIETATILLPPQLEVENMAAPVPAALFPEANSEPGATGASEPASSGTTAPPPPGEDVILETFLEISSEESLAVPLADPNQQADASLPTEVLLSAPISENQPDSIEAVSAIPDRSSYIPESTAFKVEPHAIAPAAPHPIAPPVFPESVSSESEITTAKTAYLAPARPLPPEKVSPEKARSPQFRSHLRKFLWIAGIGTGLVAVLPLLGNLNLLKPQPEPIPLPELACSEPSLPPLSEESPDYQYPDGTRYYGKVKDGIPADGWGTMVFASGNRYDGEFREGKRNGCGTLTFSNGRRYVGQFQNDQFAGVGVWTLENGDRFVGTFQNNRCHGEGVFIFQDGTFERGTWRDGEQVNGNLTCDRQ